MKWANWILEMQNSREWENYMFCYKCMKYALVGEHFQIGTIGKSHLEWEIWKESQEGGTVSLSVPGSSKVSKPPT